MALCQVAREGEEVVSRVKEEVGRGRGGWGRAPVVNKGWVS